MAESVDQTYLLSCFRLIKMTYVAEGYIVSSSTVKPQNSTLVQPAARMQTPRSGGNTRLLKRLLGWIQSLLAS